MAPAAPQRPVLPPPPQKMREGDMLAGKISLNVSDLGINTAFMGSYLSTGAVCTH